MKYTDILKKVTGQWLAAQMKAANIRQRGLTEETGIGQSTISEILNDTPKRVKSARILLWYFFNMKCKKCGNPCEPGKAIKNQDIYTSPDASGKVTVYSDAGPPAMLPVMKCTACGHSFRPPQLSGFSGQFE